MRGTLETIVGAMFAGKTSELLKRILWAKHQNKKITLLLFFLVRSKMIGKRFMDSTLYALCPFNIRSEEDEMKRVKRIFIFLNVVVRTFLSFTIDAFVKRMFKLLNLSLIHI